MKQKKKEYPEYRRKKKGKREHATTDKEDTARSAFQPTPPGLPQEGYLLPGQRPLPPRRGSCARVRSTSGVAAPFCRCALNYAAKAPGVAPGSRPSSISVPRPARRVLTGSTTQSPATALLTLPWHPSPAQWGSASPSHAAPTPTPHPPIRLFS